MSKEKMMEKFGLTEKDFEPKEVTAEERFEAIEEAVMELAEIILGGGIDG